MICRASRIEKRLASVAVIANCQYVGPKRRWSSSPTHAASSVGSMWVIPRGIWRSTAAIVAGAPWPAIAPVSPRHRST